MAAAGTIILGETLAHHESQLEAHPEAYGEDVRFQLGFGAAIRAADVFRAQHARERFASAIEDLLTSRADAMLLPTVAVEAPPIGDDFVVLADRTSVPVMSALAAFTLLHDIARLPTVAVPAGPGRRGLPTSVQVTTAFGADALALNFAHHLESALWPQDSRWPD